MNDCIACLHRAEMTDKREAMIKERLRLVSPEWLAVFTAVRSAGPMQSWEIDKWQRTCSKLESEHGMISPGELYDLEHEIDSARAPRLREIARDMLAECHRLRHLIGEMADFRSSVQHNETMSALRDISNTIASDSNGGRSA